MCVIDKETKCINDDTARSVAGTHSFLWCHTLHYIQHRRHFRTSQFNRLSFRLSFTDQISAHQINTFVHYVFFTQTHTRTHLYAHSVIYAECQVRVQYINIVNTLRMVLSACDFIFNASMLILLDDGTCQTYVQSDIL